VIKVNILILVFKINSDKTKYMAQLFSKIGDMFDRFDESNLVGTTLNLDNPYKILNVLGSGGFSTVYSGKGSKNKYYAIKVVNSGDNGIPCLMEASIVATYKHPYINHALHVAVMSDTLYIVQEQAMFDLSECNKICPLNDSDVLQIMSHIGQALTFLHDEEIIHGDIKPRNVLVFQSNKERIYKLTDFNMSRKKQWKKTPHICTPAFKPQEVWNFTLGIIEDSGDAWDESLDIWCFGLTIYYAMFKTNLFLSQKSDNPYRYLNALHCWEQCLSGNNKNTHYYNETYKPPQIFDIIFDKNPLHGLILSMLNPIKSMRPTIDSIMNNKLLKNFPRVNGNILKLTPLKLSDKNLKIKSGPRIVPAPDNIVIEHKYSQAITNDLTKKYSASYHVLKIANDLYSRYSKYIVDDPETVILAIIIMASKIVNEELSIKHIDNFIEICRIERDVCRKLNFVLH
jgi:serine/threonine protein kinase